jgi:TetR/AcrR family transcriptional regulator, tetracycline repressor protein
MAGRTASDLDADEVVDAAIAILDEHGLDAVSMRNVGARLGVSPVPLYSRVGNKDALLSAMAERLMVGMAPEVREGEAWSAYAVRWAAAVRDRFVATSQLQLVLGRPRAPFVDASRPLVAILRAQGFEPDEAVQACRLLLWAVSGFATVEGGTVRERPRSARRRAGGDPTGVTPAEADELFAIHVRHVIDGIARDHAAASQGGRR